MDNYFTGSKDNLKQWFGHPRFELIRHGKSLFLIYLTFLLPKVHIYQNCIASISWAISAELPPQIVFRSLLCLLPQRVPIDCLVLSSYYMQMLLSRYWLKLTKFIILLALLPQSFTSTILLRSVMKIPVLQSFHLFFILSLVPLNLDSPKNGVWFILIFYLLYGICRRLRQMSLALWICWDLPRELGQGINLLLSSIILVIIDLRLTSLLEQDFTDINLRGLWRPTYSPSRWELLGKC